jgi:hypothetical protein
LVGFVVMMILNLVLWKHQFFAKKQQCKNAIYQILRTNFAYNFWKFILHTIFSKCFVEYNYW